MFLKVPSATRVVKILLLASVVSCLLYLVLTEFSVRPNAKKIAPIQIQAPQQPNPMQMVVPPYEAIVPEKYNEAVVKTRLINDKIKRLSGMVIHSDDMPVSNRTDIGINYNIQIFYYCPVDWWRSTPENELPHKEAEDTLNVAFYPELGIYNCTEEIIEQHFRHLNHTGIGVIIFSWFPNRWSSTNLLVAMFKLAKDYQLKISFALEHHPDRTVHRIREEIKFIIDEFSHYESFNRMYDYERKHLFPVFYLKDTHNTGIDESDWRELLGYKQSESVRHTKYDGIFLNHITTKESLASSRRAGFDGLFSYSASNGYTYASTWKNWQHISRFAEQYKMIFIPSIGPGYEEKIWKDQRNQKQKHQICRHRSNGNYYGVGWRTALQLENDQFISISSFNNWPEGTQIEPAIQRWNFHDYSHRNTNYSSTKYLNFTRYWIGEFLDRKRQRNQHFCHSWTNNTVCHHSKHAVGK